MFAIAVTSPHVSDHLRWNPPLDTIRHKGWVVYASDRRNRHVVSERETSTLLGTLRVKGLNEPGGHAHSGDPLTDVARAHSLLTSCGVDGLLRLRGRFSLVLIDHVRRFIWASRDPLGLAPLYYREQNGVLLASDYLDTIASDAPFDKSYIASFIASRGHPNTTSTIRSGVHAVPPGSWLRWEEGRVTIGRFWNAEEIGCSSISRQDAAAEFRRLVIESLTVNTDTAGRTWAHLSGGLDSSTVVSTAQKASTTSDCEPLGGTLTFRDSLGNGDDSEFVHAVLKHYRVPNITIADTWPWQRDELGPPRTDRPARDYAFFYRDRTAARRLAESGATALLSGIGPDLSLAHTPRHCADLVWTGRFGTAWRELHAWAIATRAPIWRAALDHVVLPLTARRIPSATDRHTAIVRRWFTSGFDRDHHVVNQLEERLRPASARGNYYREFVVHGLRSAAERLSNWNYAPGLEMRHPLLYPPLVSFCLSLPIELKTDVYWPKPVLRGAMKGILPEKVRQRSGGSVIAPRVFWAFRQEREQLAALLHTPVLADIGCIEPAAVRRSLQSFDVYGGDGASHLYALLSLETWLSARSGRWSQTHGWISN